MRTVWRIRPVGESRLRATAIACTAWLVDHEQIVTWYLFAALIARSLVKVGSFIAVGMLLWHGVPGTWFDGIPRVVSIPLLALFGLVSTPLFMLGLYQDIEKAKRGLKLSADRYTPLDHVDLR